MKILFSLATFLLSTTLFAQIKNAKTDTAKVYGNCGMCKAKIEKAAIQKNVSTATWNEETGIATITYDATVTTKDAVLKKIAAVGYDSDSFKASNAAYNKLPGCCKYDRPSAVEVKPTSQASPIQ